MLNASDLQAYNLEDFAILSGHRLVSSFGVVPRDARFSSTRVAESRDVDEELFRFNRLRDHPNGPSVEAPLWEIRFRSSELVRYETPVKQRKW